MWADNFGKPNPDYSEQLLERAEAKLGVKLPEAYVHLLKKQNGGYIHHHLVELPLDEPGEAERHWPTNTVDEDFVSVFSFSGIGDDLDNNNNLLASERMCRNLNIPSHYLVLDHYDNSVIALDYSNDKANPAIVYIETRPFLVLKLANSFDELLEYMEPYEQVMYQTETLNDDTFASDPGRITVSESMVSRFHPELYRKRWTLFGLIDQYSEQQKSDQTRLREHLLMGDSRAAVVMSIKPLIVAAYTEDIDCVALLRFPDRLVKEHKLRLGSRLLTVNLYGDGEMDIDLWHGPVSDHSWTGFTPVIADFVTEDKERLRVRKSTIAETEWKRAEQAFHEYIERNGHVARDGSPLYSWDPVKPNPKKRRF